MIASETRTARREPGGRRLTPRDLVLLCALARLQPMTSTQARTLLDVDRSIARRALNKLRDLGLARVLVPAMEADNLYVLTPAGAREVARVTGRDPGDVAVLRGVAAAGMEHHAGTVDVVAAMMAAAARSARVEFEEALLDRDIRRLLGNPRDALVPDAVAKIAVDGTPAAFALEIDLATENPSWVLARKLVPYGELRAEGRPLAGRAAWSVGFVVPTLRRLHRLAAAAVEGGVPEGAVYFALAHELDARAVLAPVWRTFRAAGPAGEFRLATESPFAGALAGCSDGSTAPAGGNAAAAAAFSMLADAPDPGRGGPR